MGRAGLAGEVVGPRRRRGRRERGRGGAREEVVVDRELVDASAGLASDVAAGRAPAATITPAADSRRGASAPPESRGKGKDGIGASFALGKRDALIRPPDADRVCSRR